MGKLALGNSDISAVYLGANEILRAYLGTDIIYDRRTLDIATQELLARADALGYSKPVNIYALDDLIKGMKTIGMWGLLDLFYLFSSDLGSYASFRLLNVVAPTTHQAVGYGGLEWTSQGVKGNGTNAYLDTNFIPSTQGVKYQTYDASRGAVVNINATGSALTSYLIDASQQTPATNALYNDSSLTTNQNRINTNQVGGIVGNYSGLGLKVIERISVTDFKAVNRDEVANYTNAGTGTMNSSSQHILRNTTAYSQLGLSCYFMGSSIPDATIQNFRTIFNNYLTAIGQTPIA